MDKGNKWAEAMKTKGHSPIRDPDGTLDYFAFSSGNHNGPGCSVCGWSCCWHCNGIEDIPACDVLDLKVERAT
jgi:hypothetical protein